MTVDHRYQRPPTDASRITYSRTRRKPTREQTVTLTPSETVYPEPPPQPTLPESTLKAKLKARREAERRGQAA